MGTKHRVSPQQAEAVRLVVAGCKYDEVAEKLGVHRNTVGNWMCNDAVKEEYTRQMRTVIKQGFSKAVNRLCEQVDSENEWIAQGASREIVGRYGASVMGDDEQEITIHISGYTPAVGMPDRPDDDDET
jgi:predicted transcriptional regulator